MRVSRKNSPRCAIGTSMAYGPDTTRATKLVAAIFNSRDSRNRSRFIAGSSTPAMLATSRPCPHCPFWASIDRFTHEPIVLPAPTRSPEEILAELSTESGKQPLAALESAILMPRASSRCLRPGAR